MKQKLQVLSTETREGVSKKTNQPYKMTVCQCVLTDSDTGEIKVGKLTLPKEIPIPNAGFYEADFKIGVNFQDLSIGAQIVALRPTPSAFPSAPSSAAGKL